MEFLSYVVALAVAGGFIYWLYGKYQASKGNKGGSRKKTSKKLPK